ncbi:unnamed protein product [Symbiodinium sp. CCMP2592]|nr:unnamed protein product [Symbiodinium sp. CCMP2592]
MAASGRSAEDVALGAEDSRPSHAGSLALEKPASEFQDTATEVSTVVSGHSTVKPRWAWRAQQAAADQEAILRSRSQPPQSRRSTTSPPRNVLPQAPAQPQPARDWPMAIGAPPPRRNAAAVLAELPQEQQGTDGVARRPPEEETGARYYLDYKISRTWERHGSHERADYDAGVVGVYGENGCWKVTWLPSPLQSPPRPRRMFQQSSVAAAAALRTEGDHTAAMLEALTRSMTQLQEMQVKSMQKGLDDDAPEAVKSAVTVLPVLPPPEGQTSGIVLQDWLAQIAISMQDLSPSSGLWWSKVMELVRETYAKWLGCSPLERLQLQPGSSVTLAEGKWFVQNATLILFRLHTAYQPGGFDMDEELAPLDPEMCGDQRGQIYSNFVCPEDQGLGNRDAAGLPNKARENVPKVGSRSSATTAYHLDFSDASPSGTSSAGVVTGEPVWTLEALLQAAAKVAGAEAATRGPSLNVIKLKQQCAMNGVDGGDQMYALVDSGATHALRRARSEEEWREADPVTVNLAGGQSIFLKMNKAGTILVPITSSTTFTSAAPIVPLGALVGQLGYTMTWNSNKCKLEGRNGETFQLRVREGCPEITERDALKLIARLEDDNLEALKKNTRATRQRVKAAALAMEKTWFDHIIAYVDGEVTSEALKAVEAAPFFQEVPRECLVGLTEPVPEANGWEALRGLQHLNRRARKKLWSSKKWLVHLFAGERERQDLRHLEGHGYAVLELDITRGRTQDVLRPSVWRVLEYAARKGKIAGIIGGPPQGTFMISRHVIGGPEPLRSNECPFGNWLGQSDNDVYEVNRETKLLVRMLYLHALATAGRLRSNVEPDSSKEVAFMLEHPRDPRGYLKFGDPLYPDVVSFWRTSLWSEYALEAGLNSYNFDMAAFGKEYTRHTTLGTNLELRHLDGLRRRYYSDGPVKVGGSDPDARGAFPKSFKYIFVAKLRLPKTFVDDGRGAWVDYDEGELSKEEYEDKDDGLASEGASPGKRDPDEDLDLAAPEMVNLIFATGLRDEKAASVLEAVQDVVLYCQSLNIPVLRFHTDRGMEFQARATKQWLKSQGLRVTTSEAGVHQTNGAAESTVRWTQGVYVGLSESLSKGHLVFIANDEGEKFVHTLHVRAGLRDPGPIDERFHAEEPGPPERRVRGKAAGSGDVVAVSKATVFEDEGLRKWAEAVLEEWSQEEAEAIVIQAGKYLTSTENNYGMFRFGGKVGVTKATIERPWLAKIVLGLLKDKAPDAEFASVFISVNNEREVKSGKSSETGMWFQEEFWSFNLVRAECAMEFCKIFRVLTENFCGSWEAVENEAVTKDLVVEDKAEDKGASLEEQKGSSHSLQDPASLSEVICEDWLAWEMQLVLDEKAQSAVQVATETQYDAQISKAEVGYTENVEVLLESLDSPLSIVHTVSPSEVAQHFDRWTSSLQKEVSSLAHAVDRVSRDDPEVRRDVDSGKGQVLPMKVVYTVKPPDPPPEGEPHQLIFEGKRITLLQGTVEPSWWSVLQEGSLLIGIVVVYVDDLLICGHAAIIKELAKAIREIWKTSDLQLISDGPLRFLGIEISMCTQGYALSQKSYIEELIRLHGIPANRKDVIPLSKDMAVFAVNEEESVYSEGELKAAQQWAGELLWISQRTRPDVAFTASLVGSLATRAPRRAAQIGEKVLAFLQRTINLSLIYGSDGSGLAVYCDASFAPEGGRSHTGWLVQLHGCTIAWRSCRQSTVTLSTAESELMAMSEAILALQSVDSMLQDVSVPERPHQLFSDSTSALAIANGSGSWRTRHLRLRSAWVLELINGNSIVVQHCNGEFQPADLLTKALASQRIRSLSRLISLRGPHEDDDDQELSTILGEAYSWDEEEALIVKTGLAVDYGMVTWALLWTAVILFLLAWELLKWLMWLAYDRATPGARSRRVRRLQKLRDATTSAIQRELEVRAGHRAEQRAQDSQRQPTTQLPNPPRTAERAASSTTIPQRTAERPSSTTGDQQAEERLELLRRLAQGVKETSESASQTSEVFQRIVAPETRVILRYVHEPPAEAFVVPNNDCFHVYGDCHAFRHPGTAERVQRKRICNYCLNRAEDDPDKRVNYADDLERAREYERVFNTQLLRSGQSSRG